MSSSLEQTGTILTVDGVRLFYREWLVDRPRAIIEIVHGLGEHSGRYAHVAARMNALGIAVRAHDLRGHGRSDGRRGAIQTCSDPLTDLTLILDDFARQQGSTPFLLGHSLGGLIASRYAVERTSPLRGLILSSPALAIDMSAAQRVLLTLTSKTLPNLAIGNGLARDSLSHDVSVIAGYKNDPLVHGKITPRLVRFMLDSIVLAQAGAPRMNIPTLLQVSGSDKLVNAQGSRRFYDSLPAQIATLRWYDDAYHEIYNETPERRARVFDDLSAWLTAQISR